MRIWQVIQLRNFKGPLNLVFLLIRLDLKKLIYQLQQRMLMPFITLIQKQYQLNVKLISLAKRIDEAGVSLLKLPNG